MLYLVGTNCKTNTKIEAIVLKIGLNISDYTFLKLNIIVSIGTKLENTNLTISDIHYDNILTSNYYTYKYVCYFNSLYMWHNNYKNNINVLLAKESASQFDM